MNYPYPQNQYSNPYLRPQQNNTIIANVSSESEAQGFPLCLGQNGIFIDVANKHLYTKTMGLSQFEAPVFDAYRLEKESPSPPPENTSVEYATKDDIEEIRRQIEEIKGAHHESANVTNADVKSDKKQSNSVSNESGA